MLLGIVLLALLVILFYYWRPKTTEVPTYTRTLRWCELGKLLSIAQPMTFAGYMFLPVAVVMFLNGSQVSLVDLLLAPYSFYLYSPPALHAFYIQNIIEVHLPTCLLPLFFALLVHAKLSRCLSRNEVPSKKTFLLVSAAGLISLIYLVAVTFGEYYWTYAQLWLWLLVSLFHFAIFTQGLLAVAMAYKSYPQRACAAAQGYSSHRGGVG